MKRSTLGALGAILVLAAAAVGYSIWSSEQARASAVEALSRKAAAVFGRDEIDRSEISKLLVEIERRREQVGEDPAVILIEANAEAARGRFEKAWSVLSENVMGETPRPIDLSTAAQLGLRRHGLDGDPLTASSALGFALQFAEVEGLSLEAQDRALLLAWIAAVRAEREQDAKELAERVSDVSGPGARAIRALLALDPAKPQPKHIRAIEAAREDLLGAERDPKEGLWLSPPPELDIAIAVAGVFRQQSEKSDGAETAAILDEVLQVYPSSVEAHHWRMLVHLLNGEVEDRDHHLKWLLKNAGPADARRPSWQANLGTGGG